MFDGNLMTKPKKGCPYHDDDDYTFFFFRPRKLANLNFSHDFFQQKKNDTQMDKDICNCYVENHIRNITYHCLIDFHI